MDRTFFFCSQDCLRKFDADPPRYVRAQAGTGSRRGHGC
jgi:YHS domain-containing protein